MNPFLRQPSSYQRTPLRAEQPEPKAGQNGVVALRLYDPIDSWGGSWGVSAKEFTTVLDALPDDTSEIRLLINSPGGEVWEGLAVLNALRSHPARVIAVVEGIAASAASFIAAGVDELQVMKNAEIFVHNAWGLAIGNAADMSKLANDLTHEDLNIASIYADKAGGTVDDWMAAMGAETTYSAEEAVEAGLADRVIDPKGASGGATAAKARFDLSIFAHARREQAPTPPQTPAATASGSTHKERSTPVSFTDEQLATMRTKLGLAADASEDKIVSTVAEVMEEFVKDDSPKSAVPEGAVVVDKEMFAQLRADAAAGREAREEQQAARRAQLVQAAVADGRIAPASREGWLKALSSDPDGEKNLAGLEKGLIPVAEVGHAGHDAITDEDNLTDADLEALASATRLPKEAFQR